MGRLAGGDVCCAQGLARCGSPCRVSPPSPRRVWLCAPWHLSPHDAGRGCASRGTTARRRGRRSACCPIAWPVTFRASWIRSSRSSRRSRPRGAWKPPRTCSPRDHARVGVRWIRPRLTPVRLALLTVVTLLPDHFTRDARLSAVRVALATTSALTTLRTHVAPHLAGLPTPLGFRPHRPRRDGAARVAPHGMGADRAGPVR